MTPSRSRRWQSLRTKLTLQATLLIIGLVLVIALVTVTALSIHLYDAARAETLAFYRNLAALVPSRPDIIDQYRHATDPHIWLLRGGHLRMRSPNTSRRPVGRLATHLVWRPYLAWRLVRHRGRTLWVIDWPLQPSLDIADDIAIVMGLIVVGAAVVGGLIGRATTHRVLGPVSRMTHTVEEMLNQRRYRPIPTPSPHNDEFTQLASVLSRLITTLDAQSRRDRLTLAEAAHQLRTPLEVMRGNLGILRNWEHIDPATERDTMEALERATDDMTQLVGDLLTLEQVRHRPLDLVSFDIGGLVEEVVEDAHALAPQRDIRLHRREAGDPAQALGDLASARRALWAVMENALKYSPADTPIRVALSRTQDRVRVAVANRGTLPASEEIEHLFDRFYRGAGARSISGSGLGLAIAKALMEAQDGEIGAERADPEIVFHLGWRPFEPAAPS